MTLPAAGAYEASFDLDSTAALALRPVDRDGRLVPALVCLDSKPRSLADCHKSWEPEKILWPHLKPGDHTVQVYSTDALPWRREEKYVSRKVRLVGGETADLGDVPLGPVRGGVFGIFWRERDGALRAEKVAPQSEAFRAGLRDGDVLQEIDGKAVTGRDAAHEALSGEEGTQVELRVLRDRKQVSIRVTREAPWRLQSRWR